jgi:beta-lactamase regulating signal transducer with metallopeptidase domain
MNVVPMLLTNAAVTTLMTAAVVLVARSNCRPQFVHALAVTALLRLVLPSFWHVELATQRGARELSEQTLQFHADNPSVPATGASESVGYPPTVTRRLYDYAPSVSYVWMAVSVALLALAGSRTIQFHRAVGKVDSAPEHLQNQLGEVCRTMGARLPDIKIVEAICVPMVWPLGRRSTIMLPARLLQTLTPEKTKVLLAHEVAHIVRRDYLVRLAECFALVVFWWLPTPWLLRRIIRRSEEQCCDAVVARSFPQLVAEYAETLIDTVQFLSRSQAVLPIVASGFGQPHSLKRRLEMLLHHDRPRTSGISTVQTLLLGLLGLALLVQPTIAANDEAEETSSSVKNGRVVFNSDDLFKPGYKGPKVTVQQGIDFYDDSIANLVTGDLPRTADCVMRDSQGATTAYRELLDRLVDGGAEVVVTKSKSLSANSVLLGATHAEVAEGQEKYSGLQIYLVRGAAKNAKTDKKAAAELKLRLGIDAVVK